MALDGSDMWDEMETARNAARDSFVGSHTAPFSNSETQELVTAMNRAGMVALVDHFKANGVGSFAAQTIGVGLTSATGGVVTGTLTVGGGDID